MNRQLAETIIRYLSFSGESDERQPAPPNFSLRQWEHTFAWLDNMNLALYLLHKLRDTHDDRKLPSAVLSRLQQNDFRNRQRVDEMASQFAVLNDRFGQSGVRYAVVKGFSLVPEFCPNASLRQQSDLDYLVDRESVPAAQQVLGELGYFLKSHESSEEWIFWKSPIPLAATGSDQYEAKGRFVIELHLTLWRPEEHGIALTGPLFSPRQTIEREWRGTRFHALRDDDAFMLQVLHVMQHVLSGSIRMSWFYEIAHCLRHRAQHALFWQQVEERAASDVLLPQFVAIIAELAVQFFQAPLPSVVQKWRTELSPSVKVWLQNYGRRLAFEKVPIYELSLFSTSKLVVFLHCQFLPDPSRRRHFLRRRLLPWTRPAKIVRSIRQRPAELLDSQWRHRQFLFYRIVFHAGAGLRYLCEIPRWLWLNRAATRGCRQSRTTLRERRRAGG